MGLANFQQLSTVADSCKLSFNSCIVSNTKKNHHFDLLILLRFPFNLMGSNFCERLNCILFMLPHTLHCTLSENMLSHFGAGVPCTFIYFSPAPGFSRMHHFIRGVHEILSQNVA